MRKRHQKRKITRSLKLLATAYGQAALQLEATLAILCRELELKEIGWLENITAFEPVSDPLTSSVRPIADKTTLSVVFEGKSCFLGNTLLFRFFETISRCPNRYYSHTELLDEVWGGPRCDATIRNVAKRLRDKLNSVGLTELAKAVDGSTPGYYVLQMNRDR